MAELKPQICGEPEVYLADEDCDCCDILTKKVENLEECCEEVKETLDEHDGRITNNTDNIQQTSYELHSDYYNKDEVDALLADKEGLKYEPVDELPAIEDAEDNIIYLVPTEQENVREQFVKNGDGYVSLGTTQINVDNYVSTTGATKVYDEHIITVWLEDGTEKSLKILGKGWTGEGEPTISGANNITINVGDEFDPLEGVTAKDDKGNDITDSIQVTGTVDTETPGVYTLTYTATDSSGKEAEVTRKVTVKDEETPTTITITYDWNGDATTETYNCGDDIILPDQGDREIPSEYDVFIGWEVDEARYYAGDEISGKLTCGSEYAATAMFDNLNTVLYEDGHLVINELASDRAINTAEHGAVDTEWKGILFADGSSTSRQGG